MRGNMNGQLKKRKGRPGRDKKRRTQSFFHDGSWYQISEKKKEVTRERGEAIKRPRPVTLYLFFPMVSYVGK